MSSPREVRIKLRPRVTCPHCWRSFAPEETLWISTHPALVGDARLGDDHQQRFLPSRFNVEGAAIDSRGLACQELACPHCHLPAPRALLEIAPLFISIMGTPSCGKSYFLASMSWQLRRILPQHFAVSFGDADPVSNKILNHYEEEQFFNPRRDELVRLAKTEEQGDLYDAVRYGDQVITYPRPFLFALRPNEHHAHYDEAARIARILCLYDNAGVSFEPGKDTAANQVTRHLAQSQVLMFCFDPTQDPRFRDACRGRTHDPQILEQPVTSRQETVLHEVAARIRKHTQTKQGEKHPQPLIVIVTKYDAWWPLLGEEHLPAPWSDSPRQGSCPFDLRAVEKVSARLRALLWRLCPEIVGGAEAFSQRVVFVPVSATGCPPQCDPATGALGVRPRDLKPMWVETPLLYALARWGGGIVASTASLPANAHTPRPTSAAPQQPARTARHSGNGSSSPRESS